MINTKTHRMQICKLHFFMLESNNELLVNEYIQSISTYDK